MNKLKWTDFRIRVPLANDCVVIKSTLTGAVVKLSVADEARIDALIDHSKDDPIVPFKHLELYSEKLSNSIHRIFNDRQHLNQSEFPEIVDDIKSLV